MGGRGGGSSIASRAVTPSAALSSDDAAAQTIRQVYEQLDQRLINRFGVDQGNLNIVSMARLRDSLGDLGWSRDKQDAQLMKLQRAGKILMFPESNQKTLTPKQRDAAIHFGGQDKHLISWIRE